MDKKINYNEDKSLVALCKFLDKKGLSLLNKIKIESKPLTFEDILKNPIEKEKFMGYVTKVFEIREQMLLKEIKDEYQPFDKKERELFRSYINNKLSKYPEKKL